MVPSPQVSLLEYRKRQREARRSGSKTECSSPVSTVPPLTVDAFPVTLESTSEPPLPPAPPAPSNTPVNEPQTCEEREAAGEKEGGEGQWYVLSDMKHHQNVLVILLNKLFFVAFTLY